MHLCHLFLYQDVPDLATEGFILGIIFCKSGRVWIRCCSCKPKASFWLQFSILYYLINELCNVPASTRTLSNSKVSKPSTLYRGWHCLTVVIPRQWHLQLFPRLSLANRTPASSMTAWRISVATGRIRGSAMAECTLKRTLFRSLKNSTEHSRSLMKRAT